MGGGTTNRYLLVCPMCCCFNLLFRFKKKTLTRSNSRRPFPRGTARPRLLTSTRRGSRAPGRRPVRPIRPSLLSNYRLQSLSVALASSRKYANHWIAVVVGPLEGGGFLDRVLNMPSSAVIYPPLIIPALSKRSSENHLPGYSPAPRPASAPRLHVNQLATGPKRFDW